MGKVRLRVRLRVRARVGQEVLKKSADRVRIWVKVRIWVRTVFEH